jgi:membrane protease YdiL (CAAX protease family)
VLWYGLLACALAWLGWGPQILGSRGVSPFDHPAFGLANLLAGLSPTVAALVVLRATEGRAAIKSLLTPLVRWRVGIWWYMVALLGPVALFALASLVETIRAGGWVGVPSSIAAPAVGGALAANVAINLWEEIGWRGYALPRLQERHGPLAAALMVGTLWAVWHLPLFLVAGHPFAAEPAWRLLVGILGSSVIYAWVWNSARRSLLVVTLLHASINTVGGLLYNGSYLAVTLANLLVALVVALATRGRLGAEEPAA